MEQMQQFIRMFSSQQLVRLSTKFSPRDKTEPKMVEENTLERRPGAQANQNQPNYPVSRLEIPLFDGENLRWWIRRRERMFSLYQVQEQQEVTLASA